MEESLRHYIQELGNFRWNGKGIPMQMVRPLANYIVLHAPPGGFLEAVLRNDLHLAVSRADEENQHILYLYVAILYNVAPASCWGSNKNYEEWAKLAL